MNKTSRRGFFKALAGATAVLGGAVVVAKAKPKRVYSDKEKAEWLLARAFESDVYSAHGQGRWRYYGDAPRTYRADDGMYFVDDPAKMYKPLTYPGGFSK